MSLFEQASRLKLRFSTSRGLISTEQLWELSATALDSMYTELEKNVEAASTTGLIKKRNTKVNKELELKINIIAHVFNVRQNEQEEKEKRVASIEHNNKIDNLILKKEEASLENLSIEELKALRKQG